MTAPLSPPIQGYQRAEVEEFLAATAHERIRLEAEIADANSRITRARSAIGMHRVMLAMLLETQRELSELRQRADDEAARILADAGRDPWSAPPGDGTARDVEDFGVASRSTPTIDLTAISRERLGDEQSDEFFEFLRGASVDDGPLGPAPA